MSELKMTIAERQSILLVSMLLGLRMLGLFMVTPLFSLYAQGLPGSTPFLIGLALGIYGLCQALLQIPFGTLSDYFGRQPIIRLGFGLFILGSICCAFAPSMIFLLIGRALQGSGAIGSTLLALLSDLTREQQRSKAMALTGMAIGLSFSLALVIGPLLAQFYTVDKLFLCAAFLGMVALFLTRVKPLQLNRHIAIPKTWSSLKQTFSYLIKDRELLRLYLGIFILHAIFTALFVVLPIHLISLHLARSQQWFIYVPALLLGALWALLFIHLSERYHHIKLFFLLGILHLIMAMLWLWLSPSNWVGAGVALFLFFTGFSLLEGFLPSLISKVAPLNYKGSALGIYSSCQFMGIFVGGMSGGWLYGHYSLHHVYLFCLLLTTLWLLFASSMTRNVSFIALHWQIPPLYYQQWDAIELALQAIPGVIEIKRAADKNTVYIKMNRDTINHPSFIRLQTMVVGEPIHQAT